MSVRLYWSPIVGDGQSLATSYRPSIADVPGVRTRQIIPTGPKYLANGDLNPNAGKPIYTGALVLARATDWTAVEADATQVQLLPDSNGATPREILTWLQTRTVADLNVTYRNRWSAVLSEVGANVGDITGAMTLLKVLRRLLITLDPMGASENGFFA